MTATIGLSHYRTSAPPGVVKAATPGIPIAPRTGMTPVASVPMWFDDTDHRSCRIDVYEEGCSVEMQAPGRSSLSQLCSTLDDAVHKAESLRRAFLLGSVAEADGDSGARV
jgi:hypothetical protein